MFGWPTTVWYQPWEKRPVVVCEDWDDDIAGFDSRHGGSVATGKRWRLDSALRRLVIGGRTYEAMPLGVLRTFPWTMRYWVKWLKRYEVVFVPRGFYSRTWSLVNRRTREMADVMSGEQVVIGGRAVTSREVSFVSGACQTRRVLAGGAGVWVPRVLFRLIVASAINGWEFYAAVMVRLGRAGKPQVKWDVDFRAIERVCGLRLFEYRRARSVLTRQAWPVLGGASRGKGERQGDVSR